MEGIIGLTSLNCEYFANMIIYKINYSKQVEERPNLAEFASRKYAANEYEGWWNKLKQKKTTKEQKI